VCNHNPETVVLAHIRNQWFSRGSKPPDICGVWACSSCHDYMDSRKKALNDFERQLLQQYLLDALCRQLHYYAKEKIINW